MGYEIAAGWGAAMADPTRVPIVMVGDGTYMMMNSDIYSSVLTGHKIILIVCDNGGYAVINRLQNGKGGASFNNLIKDCRVKQPFPVDFAKHAESMGALARKVESLADLGAGDGLGQEHRPHHGSSPSSPTPSPGRLAMPGGMSACRKSAPARAFSKPRKTSSRAARNSVSAFDVVA